MAICSACGSERLIMVGDGAEAWDGDPAVQVDSLRRENDELRVALATRQVIGQATGVIAGQLGLSTGEAWQVLTVTSSFTNHRVRDIARVVVNAHDGRRDAADADLDAMVAKVLEAAVQRIRRPGDAGPE